MLFNGRKFTIRLYEIPFLLVIGAIVLISVWRCFYLPPTPRDITSGTEALAEFAVREKTMINSFFTVDLQLNNNHYKSAYVTDLQLIYKLAGLHFGQVWLSTVFVSFIIFLYRAVSLTLHRVISGLLLIAFLAIPEMYAYTFMVLFDYSNAVFFFLAIYFLVLFFNNTRLNYLLFSGVLMAVATYIRSETLVLAVLTTPAIWANHRKNGKTLMTFIKSQSLFLAPSILIYYLFMGIFVNHYMPAKYNVGALVNHHLINIKGLLSTFIALNSQLIFSNDGVGYYAWFIFIFSAFFLAELIAKRSFTKQARNYLFAVLVIYFGLPLIGFVLPIFDIENTTKRGLFKIFPLMLLYMANNRLLIMASHKITAWEIRQH